MTKEESQRLLRRLLKRLQKNHELQVRSRWQKNNIAVWENRCFFNTTSYDYMHLSPRFGWRLVSISEKPFLDLDSKSRSIALAEEEGKAE